ncbi:uncharacterized protein LOC134089347 [Sardina pilchardus]|uniref:uncharacterized protein LOC134089347 n=1 Tax=Sardina pilchardus TaxID=27697 RepID=UPI002E14F182
MSLPPHPYYPLTYISHRKGQHTLDKPHSTHNIYTLVQLPPFSLTQPLPLDLPNPNPPTPPPPSHHDLIMNLSTLFQPTSPQRSLLERGLTFIPHNTRVDQEELQRDLHQYHRRLKLINHFSSDDTYTPTPFTLPSNWEPPPSQLDKDLVRHMHKDRQALRYFLQHPPPPPTSNITPAEKQAISQLTNNKFIVIKPADKGSKIVIMDTQHYLTEAHRQLNNTQFYTPIARSTQPAAQAIVRRLVTTLYQRKFINHKQSIFLQGPDHPRPRQFYLLPKIHKPPHTWTVPSQVPPGRPIVSDCNSTTYNISIYIDSYLNPLSNRHPSYLKDTYHFLTRLRPMVVPHHTYLFTLDVDSLYTNINTPSGIQAVKNTFLKYPDPLRPDTILLELLETCLTHNDFNFDNKLYLQIHAPTHTASNTYTTH